MLKRLPKKRLSRVDLPTLGRPIIAKTGMVSGLYWESVKAFSFNRMGAVGESDVKRAIIIIKGGVSYSKIAGELGECYQLEKK
jgi:hypothetical protein